MSVLIPVFHIITIPSGAFRLRKLRAHLEMRGFLADDYNLFTGIDGQVDKGYPPHQGTKPDGRAAARSDGHYGCASSKYDIIRKYGLGVDSSSSNSSTKMRLENLLFFGEDDVRFTWDWKLKLGAALNRIVEDQQQFSAEEQQRGWVLHLGAFNLEVKVKTPGQSEKIAWAPHERRVVSDQLGLIETKNANCNPATIMCGSLVMTKFCEWYESNSWEIGCGKIDQETGEPCKNAFGEERSTYTASDWALARICREYGIKQYMFDPPIATQIPGYSISENKNSNHNVNSGAFEK